MTAADLAGWQLFNAILGWNNTATLGSVLAYVFYWILVAVTLVYLKWKEGRATCLGVRSRAFKDRQERHAAAVRQEKASTNTSYNGQGPLESPELKKSGSNDRSSDEHRNVPELLN